MERICNNIIFAKKKKEKNWKYNNKFSCLYKNINIKRNDGEKNMKFERKREGRRTKI